MFLEKKVGQFGAALGTLPLVAAVERFSFLIGLGVRQFILFGGVEHGTLESAEFKMELQFSFEKFSTAVRAVLEFYFGVALFFVTLGLLAVNHQ